MKEYRCPKCKKLLFKGDLDPTTLIEIRCDKCGDFVDIGKENERHLEESLKTQNA